ncbi:signal peptidase I [Shouchella lonarensis]|uniref:Signal peptidase I n=1 Tax=Shouchella lonarensis TaxID=1464122 RepID=A0A1G6GJU5_9BACI|nr:signal peptidase I [Shouchella lonarensis]SDB82113.1 signal peptidase I [Shouchella lonarensis]
MAEKKSEFWGWIRAIIVAVIVTLVIQTFVITSFVVSGESMEPTTYNGERFIVNKLSYRLGEPERFDLIVFKADENADYIKRVIGLPGDTIRYEDDVLYVNDEAVPEPFLEEVVAANGSDWAYTEDYELSGEVPEGYVFVLGDNRNNSLDSRRIGPVKMDDIIGKVGLRFWPLNKMGFME